MFLISHVVNLFCSWPHRTQYYAADILGAHTCICFLYGMLADTIILRLRTINLLQLTSSALCFFVTRLVY